MSEKRCFGVLFPNVVIVVVVLGESRRLQVGSVVFGPDLCICGFPGSARLGGWVVGMHVVVVGLAVIKSGLTNLSVNAVIAFGFVSLLRHFGPFFASPWLRLMACGVVVVFMCGCEGYVVGKAECNRSIHLPCAIEGRPIECHCVEGCSFAHDVNGFLHELPWRIDDVEVREVHRRDLEGLVDGGVLNGSALKEQRDRSQWSRLPFPFSSFNVAASGHGYCGGPVIIFTDAWPVVFVVVLQNLLYFGREVGTLDKRSSEIE